MLDKILFYFKTATIKQTSITFTGTFVNGLLGFVFYVLAARFFGPEDFGLFSVTILLITMVADIGDFGTNTGIVRFVSKYVQKGKQIAYEYMKLGLQIKILSGFFIFVLGELISEFLAFKIFQKPELVGLFRLGFLGVLGILLFGFATSTLQAFQKFVNWSLLHIGANFIRLLFMILLFVFGILTKESGLFLYFLVLFMGFAIFLLSFPKDFLYQRTDKSLMKRFLNYNKWVAAFVVIAAFSSRIDSFISARLLSSFDLGLYSAANQLVQVVPQFVAALGTVIAPKMASMGSKESFLSYFKKTQLLVGIICALGLLATPFAAMFIPYILGPGYQGSQTIFVILMIAMFIFLSSVPIHNAIIYYLSYPKLFLWLSLLHLFIVGVIGWIMISWLGAPGGAIAVLIGSLTNFIIPAVWLWSKIRHV